MLMHQAVCPCRRAADGQKKRGATEPGAVGTRWLSQEGFCSDDSICGEESSSEVLLPFRCTPGKLQMASQGVLPSSKGLRVSAGGFIPSSLKKSIGLTHQDNAEARSHISSYSALS